VVVKKEVPVPATAMSARVTKGADSSLKSVNIINIHGPKPG